MSDRVCIVAARRTPQGKFLGSLAKYPAAKLAEFAARPMLEAIPAEQIDLVILGNVISAGQGMNVARQAAIGLNLPQHVPAYSVNMMCASGMKAVALGSQAILTGEAEVVLAGGVESMSNAPYLLDRARTGYRLGDGRLTDAILRDGLVDHLIGEHMALTAERLVRQYGISRQAQDEFALNSHRRYFAALAAGRYADEIVAVDGLKNDENPLRSSASNRDASWMISTRSNLTRRSPRSRWRA